MVRSLSSLFVLAGLLAVVPGHAQDLPDSLPKGVTKLMIPEGRTVYFGNGICAVCHGKDAKGLTNLGNNLTDDEWIHGDGTYEGIVKTLREGAWARSGTAMPHQRATTLTDDQLLAVAAYVWSLRFGNTKPM